MRSESAAGAMHYKLLEGMNSKAQGSKFSRYIFHPPSFSHKLPDC